MNQIAEIQNSQKQIERLAAQRELYSSAKRLYIVQLIGNIIVPIGGSALAIYDPKYSAYVALYGVCFFLIDLIFIERFITEQRTKAAKIQELFDCDVLQIAKSPLKSADDVLVEEVLVHYKAFTRAKKDISKIIDWYPKKVSIINIEYARLICQKTNCWWDSKLRTLYCSILLMLCVGLGLGIIIYGFVAHLQLEQVVLIISGLIPFFQFSSKQYFDNSDSATRLTKVNLYITEIWSQIVDKKIEASELMTVSRRIQDEFYDNRIRSPLILDSFYWIFRHSNEGLMTRTAETLIEEIQNSV